MRSELMRLFERYWINIMVGAFWYALVAYIGVALWLGQSFEELKAPLILALVSLPVVLRGHEAVSWICQRLVRPPSIKMVPSYRYLLGTENRNLLRGTMDVTGKSILTFHISKVSLSLDYLSPTDGLVYPLIDEKAISMKCIIHKPETMKIPLMLKVIDQYFQTDLLNSHSNRTKLKLLFQLQYSAEVTILWRLKGSVKYDEHITYDEVPE